MNFHFFYNFRGYGRIRNFTTLSQGYGSTSLGYMEQHDFGDENDGVDQFGPADDSDDVFRRLLTNLL